MKRQPVSQQKRLLQKIARLRSDHQHPRLDWFGEVQQLALRQMNHHGYVSIGRKGEVRIGAKGRAVLDHPHH